MATLLAACNEEEQRAAIRFLQTKRVPVLEVSTMYEQFSLKGISRI
jgi:hypothetical protein